MKSENIPPMNSPFHNLNTMLDESAARSGSKPALVTADASMTYAEFRAAVLKAAAAFHERGIGPSDRVAICLRNCPEFIISYFALARLGAVAVPINFMIHKPAELAYMLNDSEAKGVITQREFLPGLLEAKRSVPSLRWVWSTDFADSQAGIEDFELFIGAVNLSVFRVPDAVLSGSEMVTILYTSGTTGNPKGVMLSHSNLISNCEAAINFIGAKPSDVILCLLPMFHTFAWTCNVLIGVRMGVKIVIVSSITPPKPWLTLLAKHRVTIFSAIPQIYSVLAREAQGFKALVLRWWFFRTVRLCISGAAPLTNEVAATFKRALGLEITEGYGLTETSPIVTINAPHRSRPGSVGLAMPGIQVKIVDDTEKQLAPWEEGEICVKGPNVMLGYFRRPKDTKDTFTKDGWFKTGDVGGLDPEGFLYLRGRMKDMIIIKGLKVFSAQVEQIISSNPWVEEVAVIGVPDHSGDETIKAFIVLKSGVAANKETKQALMQFCRQKLDAYKRPRDLEFVDALPKNALQKVLKRVLREKELAKGR